MSAALMTEQSVASGSRVRQSARNISLSITVQSAVTLPKSSLQTRFFLEGILDEALIHFVRKPFILVTNLSIYRLK